MNFLDESRNPQITSCQRRLICRLLVERDLSGLARRECDAVGDHEGAFHCTANEAPDRGDICLASGCSGCRVSRSGDRGNPAESIRSSQSACPRGLGSSVAQKSPQAMFAGLIDGAAIRTLSAVCSMLCCPRLTSGRLAQSVSTLSGAKSTSSARDVTTYMTGGAGGAYHANL